MFIYFFKKLFIFNICQQSNQAFLTIVLPLSSDDYSEEGEYEPDPQSEVHVQNDHRQESHHPDDLDSLNKHFKFKVQIFGSHKIHTLHT